MPTATGWQEQGGRDTNAKWIRKAGFTTIMTFPTNSDGVLASNVRKGWMGAGHQARLENGRRWEEFR